MVTTYGGNTAYGEQNRARLPCEIKKWPGKNFRPAPHISNGGSLIVRSITVNLPGGSLCVLSPGGSLLHLLCSFHEVN